MKRGVVLGLVLSSWACSETRLRDSEADGGAAPRDLAVPADAGKVSADSGSGGRDADPEEVGPPDVGAPDTGPRDLGVVLGPPRVETVTAGLVRPWGMAFLPDGRALITEREGRLRILGTDGQLSDPVSGVPTVFARGQSGLLDIQVGPTFAADGLIYLCYGANEEDRSGSEVARARFSNDRLEGLEVIFRVDPKVNSGAVHYGCRLAFDPSGYLFIGVGERGAVFESQALRGHLGKLLRIWPDGRIPEDNPFVDTPGAQPEIWSYGHRNIQGLAIHPTSGVPWNHEHGPDGGDEVNIPGRGENLGWPYACYGSHYDGRDIPDDHAGAGYAEPVHFWTPSIAPSGMAFYSGDLFPEWRGHLLVGALAGTSLRRLELDGDRVVSETTVEGIEGDRIREVEVGPDGAIYLLTDFSGDDRVLRVTRDRR